jgi:hypothetical protein
MPVASGGRGWTDIAYQEAIDPDGRVWELRGIENRSAANGDATTNTEYGATLWLLGPDEKPTDAMVCASQMKRIDRWLKRYPGAARVVRHGDVRPDGTACPGPHVGRLVLNGTLTESPEDDMALDATDKAWIKSTIDASNREVGAPAVWAHTITDNEGKGINAGLRLSATHLRVIDVERIAENTHTTVTEILELLQSADPTAVTLTPEQVETLRRDLTALLGPLVQASVTGVLDRTQLNVTDK